MPSTFFGLTIGTSGLYAYQAALNTTGHNMTNAETVGYSRQEVVRKASQAISAGGSYGMMGTGVDAKNTIQYRNEYYDVKYRSNNCLYGEYSTKEFYMLSVENYFSEVNSDGTTAAFNDLFNAMKGLSTDVGDATKRTEVAQYAQNFTEYVQYLAKSMKSLQEDCNFEIKATTDQINSLAQSIASVTKQINTIENNGGRANDLRDARNLMIDELSELANITVDERVLGASEVGTSQFLVRLDGKILVDTYEYNTIECVPKKSGVSQNDADGLYDLRWSNGQSFSSRSTTLGGKLQALLEVRDGNNQENLSGNAAGRRGDTEVVLTGTNCNDINGLNIPASDGMITVGSSRYEYSSFKVDIDAAGNYTYTFQLKEPLKKDADGLNGHVGESIDYKGIPYYMAKLNEFVRTFASSFNELHKQGRDLHGDEGVDFFNGKQAVTGLNYSFTENPASFNSLPVDEHGNVIMDGELVAGNYYYMTAANFCVSDTIMDDPDTIAAAKMPADASVSTGIENSDILDQLVALKSDKGMFKQGTPSAFLRTLTAEIGVNGHKATTFAKSQSNILKAIDIQRMSVSGVDKDEEGVDLVRFKQAYDLSAKFIQTMNEIYDKLINYMGV